MLMYDLRMETGVEGAGDGMPCVYFLVSTICPSPYENLLYLGIDVDAQVD